MKRTTLRLDDALLEEAKVRAARRGTTLTTLVERSLREMFAREDAPAGHRRRVELPTFHGEGWTRPGVDINDNKALWDLLDEDVGDINKLR